MERNKFESELAEKMPILRNYALKLTGDEQEAEKMVQDSLLHALEAVEKSYSEACLNIRMYVNVNRSFLNGCKIK